MGRYILSLEEEAAFDTDKVIQAPEQTTQGTQGGQQTTQGTQGSQQTTQGEQQTPEQDVEQEKVLPTIGIMSVDQTFTQSKIARTEDEMQQAKDMQQATDEAADSAVQLAVVAESLGESIRSFGTNSKAITALANSTLSLHKHKIGITPPSEDISLESMQSNFSPIEPSIALEGIMDTIRNIWKAILATISKTITWIKRFVKEVIYGVSNDIKYNRDTTLAIVRNREEPKYKSSTALNSINLEHYIANGELANKLKIESKSPVNYKTEFENILALLKPTKCSVPTHGVKHETMDAFFNKAFLKSIEGIIEKELIGDTPGSCTIEFRPYNLTTPTHYPPSTARTDTPVPPSTHCGIDVAKKGFSFYEQGPLLGNKALTHYFHDLLSPTGIHMLANPLINTNENLLELIGDWDLNLYNKKPDTTNDGWLKYIDTNELMETSSVVNEILEAVDNCEHNADEVIAFQEKLKKLIETASLANYDTSTATGQAKVSLATKLVKCLNKVIAIQNKTTLEYCAYARFICSAWNLYLKEIYTKEKAIIENSK